MNIQQISFIIPNFTKKQEVSKINTKTYITNPTSTTNLAPLKCDTVSFGRIAKNAEPLRALMSYGIPDMYSGKIVIPPSTIEELFAKHVFSKPIKNLVKIIVPFEQSLLTVEKQFFNIVNNMVKYEPQYTLADVVKKIAPEHNKKLLTIQKPIFDDIDNYAEKLPKDLKSQYDKLKEIINKKLYREPMVLPFSAKEFQYKLQRIADELTHKNKHKEAGIVKSMIQISKKIPEKTPDEIEPLDFSLSKAVRNKKKRTLKALMKKRAEFLTQIELLSMDNDLKNNTDLTKLFSQTRAIIYGIPIVIPFNRKSFIYELQKITDQLEDKKLARKMVIKATSLPTSHEDLSAFVMKCVEYSSDKIGYNMVAGSAGSIDHLIPFVKKGKDCIENYGISSAYYNSERAERPIAQQLKKYPETYVNCQKQVDRLIELCNNGTFKKVKLPKHYITTFVNRMYNLSPEDNRLILNIDKLK